MPNENDVLGEVLREPIEWADEDGTGRRVWLAINGEVETEILPDGVWVPAPQTMITVQFAAALIRRAREGWTPIQVGSTKAPSTSCLLGRTSEGIPDCDRGI